MKVGCFFDLCGSKSVSLGHAATEMFRATGGSMKSSIATLAAKAMNQLLSVNDLVQGKEITCEGV